MNRNMFTSLLATLLLGSSALFAQSGNFGIGTTTPVAKLDVRGNVKILDGTQGVGKVLVSDTAGVASWQAAGQNVYNQSGHSFGVIVNANFAAAVAAPALGANYLFNNPTVNVGNAYNTTTGVFTAPEDGVYDINATCNHQYSKNTAEPDLAYAIYYPQMWLINPSNDTTIIMGSPAIMLNGASIPGGVTYSVGTVHTTTALKAGDMVAIVCNGYGGGSVSTIMVHPARMSSLLIKRVQ